MGLENRFSTDDYSIIDLSGQTLKDKWFPRPGTFIQYLVESTGTVDIALGSGGSGPPKQITLYPGDHIQLADKDRPFSGVYISCNNPALGRLLIASSGVQITPHPGRITGIGEVGRIQDTQNFPRSGGEGMILPIRPESLTDNTGAPVAGRYAAGELSSRAFDTGNWLSLPAHGAASTDSNGAPAPLWYRPQLARVARGVPPFYPAAAGDILFFFSLSVKLGFWMEWGDTTISPSGQKAVYPIGAGASLSSLGGDRVFAAWDSDRDYAARLLLRSGGNTSRNDTGLLLPYNSVASYAAARADEFTSIVLAAHDVPVLLKDAGLYLNIRIPWYQNNPGKFRRNSAKGVLSGRNVSKPAVSVSYSAVLLKKGVDF